MSDTEEKPKQILVTVSMSQEDKEMLQKLMKRLGGNRSAVVRRAISYYYNALTDVERDGG